MSNLNLFHGKLSPLHLVLFQGTLRTTYCFSLRHSRVIIMLSPFLVFASQGCPEQLQFVWPFLRGHISETILAGFSSALSLVFVYFIQWLLNIKYDYAKSCFWRLWMLQVVETSMRARISPQLPGLFCPLWNACGKKSVCELSLQQQMWGKGTYANVLWHLKRQTVKGCFTGRILMVMCREKINIFNSPGSQSALQKSIPLCSGNALGKVSGTQKAKNVEFGKAIVL